MHLMRSGILSFEKPAFPLQSRLSLCKVLKKKIVCLMSVVHITYLALFGPQVVQASMHFGVQLGPVRPLS